MLKSLIEKLKIKSEILNTGVYIKIQTKSLKKDVEFVLHNLPKQTIKGIEILEEIFEVNSQPHQIIIKQTMNAMDIKREIGKFVYREKRWKKQEEVARKLLAEEKIDLEMFHRIYKTDDYLKVFEHINKDIFAVFYGNESMTLDEIGVAINSLYIKEFTDKNFSRQNNLDKLIDSLFIKEDN